jgi:hypothetical protein
MPYAPEGATGIGGGGGDEEEEEEEEWRKLKFPCICLQMLQVDLTIGQFSPPHTSVISY